MNITMTACACIPIRFLQMHLVLESKLAVPSSQPPTSSAFSNKVTVRPWTRILRHTSLRIFWHELKLRKWNSKAFSYVMKFFPVARLPITTDPALALCCLSSWLFASCSVTTSLQQQMLWLLNLPMKFHNYDQWLINKRETISKNWRERLWWQSYQRTL